MKLDIEKIKEILNSNLRQAKIKINLNKLGIILLVSAFVLSFIVLIFFKGSYANYIGATRVRLILLYWLLSLLISFVLALFLIYSWVIFRKYGRRKQLEDVLSDYLQLVSANVGAGMTIDQALWYAVRERFGVLAEEVETVAKKTIAGTDLTNALQEFADSYDSSLLKRSVTLLVEGLETGGEMAGLINKISWDIKENQLMAREISADVTAYSIFIGFAALIAAPLLFALSHRIIIVMADVISKIDLGSVVSVSTKLPIQSIGGGITAGDFKIFAWTSLMLTSIFSAMIISTVRKGSIKAGIRLIPVFVIINIFLFLIISVLLTKIFSGLII